MIQRLHRFGPLRRGYITVHICGTEYEQNMNEHNPFQGHSSSELRGLTGPHLLNTVSPPNRPALCPMPLIRSSLMDNQCANHSTDLSLPSQLAQWNTDTVSPKAPSEVAVASDDCKAWVSVLSRCAGSTRASSSVHGGDSGG